MRYAFTVVVETAEREDAEKVIRHALAGLRDVSPFEYLVYVSGDPEVISTQEHHT